MLKNEHLVSSHVNLAAPARPEYTPIDNLETMLRQISDFHLFVTNRLQTLPTEQIVAAARHSLQMETDGWILRGRALLVLRERALENGAAVRHLGGAGRRDTAENGLTAVTKKFAAALKIHPSTAYQDAKLCALFAPDAATNSYPREVFVLAAQAKPFLRKKILEMAATDIAENNFDRNDFKAKVKRLINEQNHKLSKIAKDRRRCVEVELSEADMEILRKIKKGLKNVAGFQNDDSAVSYALRLAWRDISRRQCRTLIDITEVEEIRTEVDA
ncbi:MAG TPA: hypothetical protein VF596_11845 [Pyrinomonadaceae bacterium]|jgi:hypothetical protein